MNLLLDKITGLAERIRIEFPEKITRSNSWRFADDRDAASFRKPSLTMAMPNLPAELARSFGKLVGDSIQPVALELAREGFRTDGATPNVIPSDWVSNQLLVKGVSCSNRTGEIFEKCQELKKRLAETRVRVQKAEEEATNIAAAEIWAKMK